MKTYPAKELKNKIGSVLSTANREPVAITRNGHFSYVILSAEDWEHLGVDTLYARRNAALLAQRTIRKPVQKKSWADFEAAGMWSDRKDMEDVDAYVRNLRKPRF